MKTKQEKETVDFGTKDRILLTYKSKWYDIVDVPGIILKVNRSSKCPFMIRLEDSNGKLINIGHDNDGGAPGSGPFMHMAADNLKMVEKYKPKRLDGKIKDVWKVGDKFMAKEGFGMDQHIEGCRTGVVQEMEDVANEELTIANIANVDGVDWIIDGVHNFFWLKEWIDPVE